MPIDSAFPLIAPARQRANPTPCGFRPSLLPAGKVRKIIALWPCSVFARAAWHNPLTLAITPARPRVGRSKVGKVPEMKPLLNN